MAPLTPPPPGTPTPPRDGRLLLRMTRPAFLTVTAVACLLGLSTAAACTGGLKVPRALATLLLALVAHAGANVLNDYFDARNGADAANDQGLFPFTGGSRLIQTGAVSVADTGRWAAFLLLALIPLGLWLAVLSGPGPLAIGAASIVASARASGLGCSVRLRTPRRSSRRLSSSSDGSSRRVARITGRGSSNTGESSRSS